MKTNTSSDKTQQAVEALRKIVEAAGLMIGEIDTCGHEVDSAYRLTLYDAWEVGKTAIAALQAEGREAVACLWKLQRRHSIKGKWMDATKWEEVDAPVIAEHEADNFRLLRAYIHPQPTDTERAEVVERAALAIYECDASHKANGLPTWGEMPEASRDLYRAAARAAIGAALGKATGEGS